MTPSPVYWLIVPSNRWTPSERIAKKRSLLLTPTLARPAPRIGELPSSRETYVEEALAWLPFTFPFNATGQPACSVPNGFSQGRVADRPADRGTSGGRADRGLARRRLRGGAAVARSTADDLSGEGEPILGVPLDRWFPLRIRCSEQRADGASGSTITCTARVGIGRAEFLNDTRCASSSDRKVKFHFPSCAATRGEVQA
jgi:hypothetical protein